MKASKCISFNNSEDCDGVTLSVESTYIEVEIDDDTGDLIKCEKVTDYRAMHTGYKETKRINLLEEEDG